MNGCMRSCWTAAGTVVLLSMIQPAVIRRSGIRRAQMPWEKVGANVGVFLAAVDSNIRIGSGIGIDIDVEEALDLESTNTVFRADALWRFTENRRHRLDLIWFAFRRDGNRRILDDIPIEDDDGNVITIPTGTTVDTFFDLDVYQLNYSYSFFQDERIDLAAGIGVYVMPINLGIQVSGLVDEEGEEKFTAPLPVFNLRMDIALDTKMVHPHRRPGLLSGVREFHRIDFGVSHRSGVQPLEACGHRCGLRHLRFSIGGRRRGLAGHRPQGQRGIQLCRIATLSAYVLLMAEVARLSS
jgi:hypothetical protein